MTTTAGFQLTRQQFESRTAQILEDLRTSNIEDEDLRNNFRDQAFDLNKAQLNQGNEESLVSKLLQLEKNWKDYQESLEGETRKKRQITMTKPLKRNLKSEVQGNANISISRKTVCSKGCSKVVINKGP